MAQKYTTQEVFGTPVTAPSDFGLTSVQAAPKKPAQTVKSPYVTTQTGVEIPNPGQSMQPTPAATPDTSVGQASASPTSKSVVSTFTDYQGRQIAVYNDGTTAVVGQGKDMTADRKSAFDLLKQEFERYGLGSLVGDTLALAQDNVSPAEFALRLRQTEPYKTRFAANETRIKNGLSALSEAQYIALEDQYQNIMRQYGLPKSMYATGDMGVQPGLQKFIAGDVSPAELESRINTAVNRVQNAPPEVLNTLAAYYPNITKDNLVAYVLDPEKALPEIQRQVQAAEIGGAASRFGLAADRARAEELAAAGISKEAAQQGYQTIADILPRGSQLSSIYKQTPYTQAIAEQEAFGLGGAQEAAKQRKKLTQLEQASFSGQAGRAGGALSRERAGSF